MKLPTDRVRSLELLAAGMPTGVALLVLLVAFYLHSFDPVNYVRLIGEDFYAEYATALSFLLAGSLFAVLACRRVSAQKRFMFALTALLLATVGMEELSWGQRILGFSTPQFMEAFNQQGELTLHNTGAARAPLHYRRVAIVVWSVASLLLPIVWPRLHRWLEHYGVPLAPAGIVPVFLIAVVLDETEPVFKAQELMELLLGLGFAFLAVDLFAENLGHRRSSPRVAARNAALLLLVLAIFTTSLVALYGGSLEDWMHAAGTKFYPKSQMYDQADAIFDYIYRHPELMRAETPIRHAEVLQQAGRQAEAEIILRQALARESGRQPPAAWRGTYYRRVAQIQLMLGLEEEAAAGFEQSLLFDRESLAVVATADEKARLLLSIAQTLAVQGDQDAARRAAQEAVNTAASVRMRHRIRGWVKKKLLDQ